MVLLDQCNRLLNHGGVERAGCVYIDGTWMWDGCAPALAGGDSD